MLRVRKRGKAAADGSWILKINAQIDLSTEARNRIAAIDSRVPTIGFERLVVIPENDLKVRLDVLSNLAMLSM